MMAVRDRLFAQTLERELERWEREGIVSNEQTEKLRELYEMKDQPEVSGSTLAMRLILILGALMLGIGIVSLVAFNWPHMAFTTKAILLNSTLALAYGAGIWLYLGERFHHLGHALILIGCILFGADLGLMSQGTNTDTGASNGMAVWAIGSLAVGASIGSLPIGFLALFGGFQWAMEGMEFGRLAVPEVRFIVVGFVFLAYGAWRDSKWMTSAAAILAGGGLLAYMIHAQPGWWLLSALAVGFSGLVLGLATSERRCGSALAQPLTVLGTALMLTAVFFGTFHYMWDPSFVSSTESDAPDIVPAYAAVAVIAVASLLACGRVRILEWVRMPALWVAAVGFALQKLASMYFMTVGAATIDRQYVLSIMANLGAVLIGSAFIVDSIRNERRLSFWVGAVLLGALVLARFFEYESSLQVKAAAFIVCGLALMVAGTLYERALKRKEGSHAKPIHA